MSDFGLVKQESGMVISQEFASRLEVWADKQFPQATQLSRANHLKKEVEELILSLEVDPVNGLVAKADMVAEEVGDCMSLLLHIITNGDIDIEAELERKLKINMARDWGEPNEKGFVEHVRAQGEQKP